MEVFRIVKSLERAWDFSGTGAFKVGGRWNSPGTFALYTSMYRSLALLELIVHMDSSDLPPDMQIVTVDIPDSAPILNISIDQLPRDWRLPDNLRLKEWGDELLNKKQYLGFRVPSAVMPLEHNVVLNPLFPDFNNLVTRRMIESYLPDDRLRDDDVYR